MFQRLGLPPFLDEARRMGRRARSPIFEIFIFLLVYVISSYAQSFLLSPVLFVLLLMDPDFYGAVVSADGSMDMTAFEGYLNELSTSPVVTAASLFTTAAVIIAVFVYCRAIEKRSFFSMGLSRTGLRTLPLGALFGVLMITAALGFSAAFGAVRFDGLSDNAGVGYILVLLLGFLIQGFAEELLLRGYLMTSLARSMPLWMSLIISAAAFSALHVGNTGFSFLPALNLFLFGIFTGLYFIRTGSLWGVAALHALWNFAEGVLFRLPVSGMSMPSSLISVSLAEAGARISGGEFGPEGGIAVTFVLVFGIAVLLMMNTKDDRQGAAPTNTPDADDPSKSS